MSKRQLINPQLLPLDESLQKYLTSSNFLPNNIWQTRFSPCSNYLAVPKQDIYGHDIIIVLHSPNWHATGKSGQLYVHEEFQCSSSVWSIAFGRKSAVVNENYSTKKPRSNSTVNCRHNFTKNLFLAAGLANGKINIWNIDTGELTLILQDHKSTVCSLAFTLNSMQLVSTSHDKTIKLWDLLDDGNMYKTIHQCTFKFNTVQWSPDETLLCAVGPFVLLYETVHWRELFKFDRHEHTVADCVFSSDSALLATASFDTRVLLWSTATGELLKQFAHQIPIPLKVYAGGDNGSFIRSLAFTKFDQFITTTCDDNYLRWFPIQSSFYNQSISQHKQTNVLCIANASDGQTMAIGTRTGQVHLWSTNIVTKPPTLKHFCRVRFNQCVGLQRKNIQNLLISQHLIRYLLYKDIQMK